MRPDRHRLHQRVGAALASLAFLVALITGATGTAAAAADSRAAADSPSAPHHVSAHSAVLHLAVALRPDRVSVRSARPPAGPVLDGAAGPLAARIGLGPTPDSRNRPAVGPAAVARGASGARSPPLS